MLTQVLSLGNDQDQQPLLESGISLNKTKEAPKEDEEHSDAIDGGVRTLRTMFTVFLVRELKNSQVQVTKRLFTHQKVPRVKKQGELGFCYALPLII